jgi:hypothetical protein
MTDIPPSDPRSSERNPLGFDEFIAILVALATIGTILFWAFSRKDSGWNFADLTLTPTPSATTPAIGVNGYGLPEASVTPPTTVQPNRANGVIPPIISAPNVVPTPTPTLVPSPAINPNQLTVVRPSQEKSTFPPPIVFTDVPDNFWANGFIDTLSSRKIIEGYKDYSFRPNQPVDRAEYAAILQKAFSANQTGNNTVPFKDIASNYWANPAIDQSIKTGFLRGYPDQTFQPEKKIPRVEVLVALVSGLNLRTPASPEKVISVYKDAKDIPKYAIGKIAAATENGLVVNYPDQNLFNPNKEATRAEVAAMVHQSLVKTRGFPPIQSPYIVGSN